MEVEVLGEKACWEARRVAAAFRLQGHNALEVRRDRFIDIGIDVPSLRASFRYRRNGMKTVEAHLLDSVQWRISLETGFGTEGFQYVRNDGLHMDGAALAPELMVALFKLGLDLEPLQSLFDLRLTAHEQIEARLSMPRRFWPGTWLDEEEGR